MVTSWTSQTCLPCEDICWKAFELNPNPSRWVIAAFDWQQSVIQQQVEQKGTSDRGFGPFSSPPFTAVFSPGHLLWNLCIYLEWVSEVTIHHLLYRSDCWYFILKYDYRACTPRMQNYNPCEYCTGVFSIFFFCNSILLLNSSFHVWFINLE